MTRPGEAIYNDANGLFEGNHPFQVVWLPDDERDELSRSGSPSWPGSGHCSWPAADRLRGQRAGRPGEEPGPAANCWPAPAWPEPSPAGRAWLGAAVAIKEPTSILFSRQSGNHFLVVGHQEDEALGVLATAL